MYMWLICTFCVSIIVCGCFKCGRFDLWQFHSVAVSDVIHNYYSNNSNRAKVPDNQSVRHIIAYLIS